MGIFGKLFKSINPVNAIKGTLKNPLDPAGIFAKDKPNTGLLQPVDKSMYQTYGQQAALADKFRESLPQAMEEQRSIQSNMAEQDARTGLQSDIRNIRDTASSRGLLYGGVRQGSESAAEGERSNQLAQHKAQINQNLSLLDRSQAYDMKALNTAFDIQQLEQNRYDLLVNEINLRNNQQADLNAGYLSAAGKLFGNQAGKWFGGSESPYPKTVEEPRGYA